MSLQIKYTFTFSVIVLGILIFLTYNMIASEQDDLMKLSKKNFTSIYNSVNIIAEEALSVGTKDKIALKSIVNELFDQEIDGLLEVLITDRKQHYFVQQNKNGNVLSDQKISDSLWTALEEMSLKKVYEKENAVYLTKKIIYQTARKDIFLGFSQLTYSTDHINELINDKRNDALIAGLTSFFASLLFVSFVTSILVRRIKRLRDATYEISAGNFITLPVSGQDEIATLTNSFNNMTVAVKERLLMSKYVSDSTINLIQEDSSAATELGGIKEIACILFTDIRGFTSFSEKHNPQTVVQYLNDSLDLQVRIIKQFGGDIDKFIGDAVMAIFRGENKEKNAILASIAIQKKLRELILNDELFGSLHIGIGINTGETVTGNIGSKDRMDFTAIGDSVNTASRICGAAKSDQIVISESVKNELAEDSFKFSKPFEKKLKNKVEPLKLYRILYA